METKTSGEGRVDRLSDKPPDATHQQKPRFLQFSLRQFLLLVAVFGVLLSVIAPPIHRTFQEWRGQEATRRREAAGAELSTAVRTNNIALARHALEAGADPNLILTGGPQDFVSALGTCIKNGQIEIMELLLDFGVDVERIERLLPRAIVVGGSPLFAAIGSNQPPEVRINMARLLVARRGPSKGDRRSQCDGCSVSHFRCSNRRSTSRVWRAVWPTRNGRLQPP